MASDQMTVAALGRPFTLGMFYDARKDELLPGFGMWDSETLQKITHSRGQASSEFHVTASDSTEEKTSLLSVEASLKLSFLSGLVEVGGSAKYLNNHRQFKNQSRVTLQYKATTHFEQLSLTTEDYKMTKNREIIEKGMATHVVTAIMYGAHAFFVFDSKKIQKSDVQEIETKMEAVIKKIPSFDMEGRVEMHLSSEEKALVETFSCEFYGDFILQSNPSTFVSAVQTYVDLPKLLKGSEKNAVPLKVWMMPLINFEPEAAKILKDISVGFVIKAENTLDELAGIIMRCNDYLNDSTVQKFPELRDPMTTYHKLCVYYTSELKKVMEKKCPAIREGKEDESALRSAFEYRDQSPFSQERLDKWLDDKEREMNVVRSCVQIMKGIKILSTQDEVDEYVLAPGGGVRWIYVFSSLGETDPFHKEMERYLDALKSGTSFSPAIQNTSHAWYFNDEIVANMRQRANSYASSSDTEAITAKYDGRYPGSATYKYQNGALVDHWGIPN